jgi:hypothetical protein
LISAKFENTSWLAEWKSLHSRTDGAASRRNALAHYWVLHYFDEKPGRRVCLVPKRGIVKEKQKVPAGTLCVKDISKLVMRFTAITNALQNYAARLRGRPERYPKELEQEKPALSLVQLRHEIYAFANTPPKPKAPEADDAQAPKPKR